MEFFLAFLRRDLRIPFRPKRRMKAIKNARASGIQRLMVLRPKLREAVAAGLARDKCMVLGNI